MDFEKALTAAHHSKVTSTNPPVLANGATSLVAIKMFTAETPWEVRFKVLGNLAHLVTDPQVARVLVCSGFRELGRMLAGSCVKI